MNIPVLFGFKYQVKALSFSENEAEPMDMKRTLTRKNKQLNNWQRRRGSTHNVAGVAAIKVPHRVGVMHRADSCMQQTLVLRGGEGHEPCGKSPNPVEWSLNPVESLRTLWRRFFENYKWTIHASIIELVPFK